MNNTLASSQASKVFFPKQLSSNCQKSDYFFHSNNQNENNHTMSNSNSPTPPDSPVVKSLIDNNSDSKIKSKHDLNLSNQELLHSPKFQPNLSPKTSLFLQYRHNTACYCKIHTTPKKVCYVFHKPIPHGRSGVFKVFFQNPTKDPFTYTPPKGLTFTSRKALESFLLNQYYSQKHTYQFFIKADLIESSSHEVFSELNIWNPHTSINYLIDMIEDIS